MKSKLYIISQSSIDLVSTLNHYERFRSEYDVKIIVSSTFENLQFLQSVNIPESALEYLYFPSKHHRLRQLFRYVGSLWKEKKALDQLANRIRGDPKAEVIFHSWHMDPHTSYLISLIARTHKVSLIDILALESDGIPLRKLMSTSGVKTIFSFFIFRAFFGPIFFISGSREHQFLCLDLKRVPVDLKPKSEGGTISSLGNYLYKPECDGKTAILTFRDPWGVDVARQLSIYQSIIEVLLKRKYKIAVKVHPQSSIPSFFSDYEVKQVPKYIPFEFIDLKGLSLVVGLSGASLVATEAVTTVSFLPMVYEEHSGYYDWEMSLLSKNKAIKFVHSADEFNQLLDSL